MLFWLSTVASSLIGPLVIQVIIDATGNNWLGFPFLFGLCLCSFVIILFGVDVEKGRRDAAAWAIMRSKVPEESQETDTGIDSSTISHGKEE